MTIRLFDEPPEPEPASALRPHSAKWGRRLVRVGGALLGTGALMFLASRFIGRSEPRVSYQGGGYNVVLGWRDWLFIVGGGLGVVGYPLLRLGKSLRARSAPDTLSEDGRRPVLYLRSFSGESWLRSSLEERIQPLFQEKVGPVVAIGRPGERLVVPGAARIYVDGDVWQAEVSRLLAEAGCVIWRFGRTPGASWEFSRLGKLPDPTRLLLIIPDPFSAPADYDALRIQASTVLPLRLPERPSQLVGALPPPERFWQRLRARHDHRTRCRFLTFDPAWEPVFLRTYYFKHGSILFTLLQQLPRAREWVEGDHLVDVGLSLQPFIERLSGVREGPLGVEARG